MKRFVLGIVFAAFWVNFYSLPLKAATPSGGRGGKLSASEEAQQKFLRRLRHEIAVQRILSNQLLGEEHDKSSPSPIIERNFLTKLSDDGVSPSTLVTLKTHPAVYKSKSDNVDNAEKLKSRSTKRVEDTFQKLGALFKEQFGQPLTNSTGENPSKVFASKGT